MIEPLEIPQEVIRVGVAVGLFRNEISRLQGRKTRSHSGDASGKWSIPGSIAEALLLWEYPTIGKKWTWRAVNSVKNERDCGPFEVEATMGKGRALILREADLRQGMPEETPYVSVYLEPSSDDYESCSWKGCIQGWLPIGAGIAHPNAKLMPRTSDVWLLAPELLYPIEAYPEIAAALSAVASPPLGTL
jgi:hypothetical protein